MELAGLFERLWSALETDDSPPVGGAVDEQPATSETLAEPTEDADGQNEISPFIDPNG